MDKLAINGGRPVRHNFIPYGRQTVDQADIDLVVSVLKGEFLTTGPTVGQFEEKIANYVGSKYAVAFANGTAALHGAAFAAGLQPGDEAIVPAMTFAASANCVRYCGAKPIFADINPHNLNIDISQIEGLITEQTKAIVPVDYTGQAVDIDSIMEIASRYNLTVIEDGAHSLGSLYKGEKVGTRADMTMFSFHPVKPITTAEGGVITTNSKELYNRLILFRSHGITRNPEILSDNHGPWYYEQLLLGYNYRLSDVQAALGLSQLDKLDHFLERRRQIAGMYDKAFKENPYLQLPVQETFSNSGRHIYVIMIRPEKLLVGRREVFEALLKENIGVNVHYLPVYLLPYYQHLGYSKGLCPVAEEVYQRMMTIPLFPGMSDKDVRDVIDGVNKVVQAYAK